MQHKYLHRLCPALIGFFAMLPFLAFAQTAVTGRVTDATSNDGIPGVNVTVRGTQVGTITDVNGGYSIVLPSTPAVLQFSFVGYVSQNLTVGATSADVTLDVSLREDLVRLNEVVVTGTATATNKAQIGNAISTVSSKELQNSGAQSIDAALTGKLSGALIQQNSGNPAGGISVRLRGISTISGSSDPLYIIDGVIVNNDSPQLLDWGGMPKTDWLISIQMTLSEWR